VLPLTVFRSPAVEIIVAVARGPFFERGIDGLFLA
jgi:hypothetical protein